MAIRNFALPPREPQKSRQLPPGKRSRIGKAIAGLIGVLAGILAAILVVIAIGIYVSLYTNYGHGYVLGLAEKQASESLNTRVEIQNFTLHFWPPRLDLYGLTVYGAGPGANAPLLQVNHIGLGVRIISILHRQWDLRTVVIDHPVASLIVNSAGQSNLPAMRSGGSRTNIFDLAVRHIRLNRGSVYYNNRQSVLDADLHDLSFQSSYDASAGGRYFGAVSYRNGDLQYNSYEPLAHDLQAQFDARRTSLTLSNVTLKSGESQILLDASLENYSHPRIHAKYVILLSAGELRHILQKPSLPVGLVVIQGTAGYAGVPGRAWLDTASLEGTVRSAVLHLEAPTLRTDIRDLAASYKLANGNAELQGLSARLLGGELEGNAIVRNLSGKQQGQVNLALRNISLAQVITIANAASLKPAAISGRASANTQGQWSGSVRNLVLRSDLTAVATIASTQPNGKPAGLPVNANLHVLYDGASKEVTLSQSYVRMPQTSIELNGTVSRRSALQVRMRSNDLHEFETLADVFRPAPAQPLDLYGTASLDATVRGTTNAPQIKGQLSAHNLQVHGSTFRALRTSLHASPSQFSLQNGDLELGRHGRLMFTVQSGLQNWSHTPERPFSMDLTATQLPVADLAHAASLTTPVSGTLSANIAAHGTQLSPIGQGRINLRNASICGQPIPLAQVRFQGTGESVHADLLAYVSNGTTQGQITYYPKQQGYDAQLQATGIELQQLQMLQQHNLQASGTLSLTASGRGTFANPQGTASLTIPQLDIEKQQVRNVSLQAAVANHEATFTLGSQVLNAPLKAQGKVALTGDYYAEATLDTPVIQLQPLIAAYSPAQAARTTGQTQLHASLRGPLKNKKLLEAHLDIPTLAMSYQAGTVVGARAVNLQIAAVKPIEADYANQVLSLQPGEIQGTDTDVRFQGQLPLAGNAPSTLSVQGNVDLRLAQTFNPNLTAGGQLQFDINAAGHRPGENAEGTLRIVNASFATVSAPIGLTHGNGVLTLRRDRLDITQFTGNLGGGAVTASGGVTYRPAIQFNIGLQGNDLRLLYPAGVRTDLGLNLAMTGTVKSAVLAGQVNINGISFTPAFDVSSFVTQFGAVSSPPPTESFSDNVKLNVAVRSTSELNAVSPTLSIRGDVNLRAIGTAADPVIVGRANLTGGDLIFMGNRYVVRAGTITFVNSIQTEPVVNLEVDTTVQQYKIALRFRGPLDRLRTNYTSDPALAQTDIIHLLAFGNTEEAANAAPSQSATLGAESLVASQVASQVTSRLQRALGVSQISLDPQLGATTANEQQGARLTVRQRVTSKLYVTFSTDVTAAQFSAVQVQYKLSHKWSLSGVRDENGGFGLDGRYHKNF
ncbi:MAG TPA: translocation/assembly module TamB domain-containing protein [Terriglobales bacterium]|nr:translocation/assembly module TamB domain-containing protein [Terriglobales bacterium]